MGPAPSNKIDFMSVLFGILFAVMLLLIKKIYRASKFNTYIPLHAGGKWRKGDLKNRIDVQIR
jgi:hypothetical protein